MTVAAGISWSADYEGAIRQVRPSGSGRLTLVYFRLEGRPMCQAMEQQTLARPEVAAAVQADFLPVKVEIDRRPELFARLVGGAGGLATCIVDGAEDVVSVAVGHSEPESFLQFLDTAKKGYPRLRAARAAVGRKPQHPASLLALAETYEALGSPRRAEEAFGRIVTLAAAPAAKPAPWLQARAASHERLARFAVMRGRNLEARQQLDAYRKLAVGAANGSHRRPDRVALTEGLILAVERRMTEAVAALEQAVKAHPDSDEFDHLLFALGSAEHERGDDARALPVLETLLARYPGSRWRAPALQQIAHIKNPATDHQH